MYKKIYVPLVLALVAALAFSSVAFAKSPLPAGVVHRVGNIISVDMAASTFKFDTLSGLHYTIHVNSSTIYLGAAGLAGLKASDRVNLEVRQLSIGSWTAERVRVIPMAIETLKEHGVVTGVTATTFTIQTRENEVYTYQVTSKTTFGGLDVPHLRELKVGMDVTVSFRGASTAILQAMHVFITRK